MEMQPNHSRRNFLKNSAVVALTPTIPTFLASSLQGAKPATDEPILVVVQLNGGNDGVNTVVPFKDEGYAKHRSELKLATDRLIKLDDQTGLHPGMRGMGELFDDGRLAIVQGVGYPNPNRSHFDSMTIWHAADPKFEQHNGNGWLGHSLSMLKDRRNPDSIFVGKEELPIALRGRRCVSATISSMEDMAARLQGLNVNQSVNEREDLTSFLTRNVSDAFATAESLSKAEAKEDSNARYFGELGNRMKMISQMIKSGAKARVYYTSQDGYDTHAVQLNNHANLLRSLSGSVKTFLDDMKDSGLEQQVTLMVFSEFGRRVIENGSAGTDHGTAGPVFLAGGGVKGGLHGKMPSLNDLDAGDLKYSTDFRNVYVTVIDQWINVQRPRYLDKWKPLELFA